MIVEFRFFLRFTILFLLFVPEIILAQNNEVCGMSSNKKAVKEYQKGLNKKKYSFQERQMFFKDALELDPDFTQALWNKTFMRIKTARAKHKPYQAALNDLLQIVDNCPNIHSAPFFFIAEIYMSKGDFENAKVYYNKFLHFSSDDDSKFEQRYDEQIKIAKTNHKLSQFLAEQYANPVAFNPIKVSPLSTQEHDEYLPTISPDNEVMLYTRRIKLKQSDKESYVKSDRIVRIERFSVSNRVNGHFEEGQAFGPPFNTNSKANYGGSAITIDNKEIYFTICEPLHGRMNCDIYVSRYEFSPTDKDSPPVWHWTTPQNLGPSINTDEGWEAQPTISKDGKWLMFAVKRNGTRGIDLYQSFRNPDGTWSKARSMGEPINTAGDEKSPFFHSDVKSLYFASRNGHLGLGGYDVFKSTYENGKWSEPINLGYPLNTPDDEHGYVISLDGKIAYFGSSSPFHESKSKSIDIYSVTLPANLRPEKVLMVKGTVQTSNHKIPENAVVQLRNTKTQKVESFKVSGEDGAFTAIVNVEDSADYVLIAKGENLAFNNQLIHAPKPNDPVKTRVHIEVSKSKVGQHITIENIHFKSNSADLDIRSRASLDALIEYLNEHPKYHISIEGHTDNIGDAKSNLALSTDRAYSVMAYLQEHGIEADRLKFKGWGAQKPIATNKTEEGRALNRRIEIVFLTL